MIPLAVPNLTGNEKKYLNQCIDSTFVSSVGEFVIQLETLCAKESGAEFAVATSAGTTALHIALVAQGVGPDDLVVVPSFTFIASANAISHCGAKPLFADINPDTWTIDPDKLEQNLQKHTMFSEGKLIYQPTGQRIAAMMPVYTLGQAADMDSINQIAEKYNLPVIADAAAALGARYKGRNIGRLATVTALSFNGNKTVTSGGGGMILTNQKELADTIRHLLSTARVGVEYNHDQIGYNYRMTNIEAAVGLAQMERLLEFVQKKQYIRNYYNNAFAAQKGVGFFPDEQSACWFSGVVLNNGQPVSEVCSKLKELGVEGRTFWKPVHLQKPYENAPKFDMRVSEDIWHRILTLPCSTGITNEELETVVEAVKSVWEC